MLGNTFETQPLGRIKNFSGASRVWSHVNNDNVSILSNNEGEYLKTPNY